MTYSFWGAGGLAPHLPQAQVACPQWPEHLLGLVCLESHINMYFFRLSVQVMQIAMNHTLTGCAVWMGLPFSSAFLLPRCSDPLSLGNLFFLLFVRPCFSAVFLGAVQ